jgi:hypothetical protein
VLIAEEATEEGVFEGVVVGEWDFVEVVGVDEFLARGVVRSVPPSHHAANYFKPIILFTAPLTPN